MQERSPRDYSAAQRFVHWAVFALVLVQLLFHDPMERAWRAHVEGAEAPLSAGVALHIATGVTILALMMWRIILRSQRGAPPVPPDHPAAMRLLAYANHYALYAMLIIMPLTGASAWFLDIRPAAGVHALGKNILLGLVLLHVAGALVEHFVMRSNVLRRMLGRTI